MITHADQNYAGEGEGKSDSCKAPIVSTNSDLNGLLI